MVTILRCAYFTRWRGISYPCAGHESTLLYMELWDEDEEDICLPIMEAKELIVIDFL